MTMGQDCDTLQPCRTKGIVNINYNYNVLRNKEEVNPHTVSYDIVTLNIWKTILNC